MLYRLMVRNLYLIICLIVTQPLLVQPSLAAEQNPNTILILGDSLSAGFGINQQDSWPALLQQQLHKQDKDWQVINASISGATSAEGLAQIKQGLLQTHQPQILVLELGANDGLRGLSLAAMESNLQKIIEQAQGQNIRVLLLGIRLPKNYGPRFQKRFEQVFASLARQYALSYHPFFLQPIALKPHYFLADRLHPNTQAQPLIMEEVWRKLQPLLSES